MMGLHLLRLLRGRVVEASPKVHNSPPLRLIAPQGGVPRPIRWRGTAR